MLHLPTFIYTPFIYFLGVWASLLKKSLVEKEVLANATVVIILQYINTSNQHVHT